MEVLSINQATYLLIYSSSHFLLKKLPQSYMKVLNLILAGLFTVFAIVQYNDPDPWLWIAIYLFMAVISGMAAFGNYQKTVIAFGLGFCLVYLVLLLPDFVDWLTSGAESIVGSMKAEKPHIELTREFLGLVICLTTLFFHWRKSNQIIQQ